MMTIPKAKYDFEEEYIFLKPVNLASIPIPAFRDGGFGEVVEVLLVDDE
jgi:hypothetical protein